jgi:hypothetical protein
MGDCSVSRLQVDQLASRTGTGNITIPSGSRLVGTDVGSISSTKGIVQMQYATAMPSAHITVTSTSDTTLGLTLSITPVFSNSIIKVEFFSTMMLGNANILVLQLQRKIGAGSYTTLTPATGAASRYQYGWTYNQVGWSHANHIYFDAPATTSTLTYQLLYRNWSSTATNYLVHQYMEYGWIATEIKQ